MKPSRRNSETTIIENNDAPIFSFCHLPTNRPSHCGTRSRELSVPVLMIERWDGTQMFSVQQNTRKRSKAV